MNIGQAKAIPIAYILEKLGQKPVRKSAKETWYLSPFRNEKTASFHVNEKRNVWYDFGVGIGGDAVDFGCSYLAALKQSHSVADALTWIKATAGEAAIQTCIAPPPQPEPHSDPKLLIRSVKAISSKGLVNYLESRGIPEAVGLKWLKEVRIHNKESGKNIFALGIKNEADSYEVRNPFFKGCVGTKHISFLRGKNMVPDGIHLFEGFMDFLSAVTAQEGKAFTDDVIILNSLACIKLALAYIKDYGYAKAYTWMDNDSSGKSATLFLDNFFKSENKLIHQPMNDVYKPFKDVNAWHMSKLEL